MGPSSIIYEPNFAPEKNGQASNSAQPDLENFQGGLCPDFAENPNQTQAALGGGVPAWDTRGTAGTDPLGGNHRCVTRL